MTIIQNNDVVVGLSRSLVTGVPTAEPQLVTYHRGPVQIGIVALVHRQRRKPVIYVITVTVHTTAIPAD